MERRTPHTDEAAARCIVKLYSEVGFITFADETTLIFPRKAMLEAGLGPDTPADEVDVEDEPLENLLAQAIDPNLN